MAPRHDRPRYDRFFDEEPEKPTKEEFEIHAKVERYWAWAGHQMDLSRGRFELRYESDMPPLAVTEHGEQPMTDEMFERLGFIAVTDENDETVVWSSAPGWR